MILTGPPRFADTLRPYLSKDAWLDCRWEPEPLLSRQRGGLIVIREERWRLRGQGGYEALDEQTAIALRSELARPFPVVPRTRADGDPLGVEETEVLCRLTSPLPETTALYRRGDDGRPVWRFEVEFEALAVLAAPPTLIILGLLIDNDFSMLVDEDDASLLG